jgi:hypothetical protein
MKKGIIALVVLVLFCLGNVAMAATQAPVDVPKDHWAYPAVKALIKDGIIDGYGDGTYMGNKTITRYEMAAIVSKAMANSSKATAEQKALIDKLASEFALELNKIDVRVTALEKDKSTLKIDGFFQEREEWIKNPVNHIATSPTGTSTVADTDRKNMQRTALWLNLSDQFDGSTYFHGVLWAEMFPGVASQNTDLAVHEAFVAKKIGNGTELAVGEFFPVLGQGTLMSTPMMQGARASYTTDNFKFNFYDVTFNVDFADGTNLQMATNNDNIAPGGIHYNMGDVKYSLGKATDLTFAMVQAKGIVMGPAGGNAYKDWAVGGDYKGIPGLVLTGEYAQNTSYMAKYVSGKDAAKAYFVNLKYKGANPFQVGSTGVWAEYKMADNGFDLLANAGPNGGGMDYWNCPFNYSAGAGGGDANNMKGFEYGVETTVAPRLIFTAAYDKLKSAEGLNTNRDFASAQFWYLF